MHLQTYDLFFGNSQNIQNRYGNIITATKVVHPILCLLMAIKINMISIIR